MRARSGKADVDAPRRCGRRHRQPVVGRAKLGSANTYVDYAASKGAVDTFTIGLGHEVAGEGIRVAAIRPGLIDTEIHASGGEPDRAHRLSHMVPMKRVGTAEEIANAIVWLMSDEPPT